MNEKELKQLELENDKALVDFWKAVMDVRKCQTALSSTQESIALSVAETIRDSAEGRMSKARSLYLAAKIKYAEAKQ